MKKQTLIIITVVVLSVAGAAGFFAQRYFNNSAPGLLKTKLPDLADNKHALAEWQGKILVVNFWATWCPGCLAEIPDLMRFQRQYADKNIQFIGVAVDEKKAVQDYINKNPISYPVLIAGDLGIELSKTWGNAEISFPFTVVINSQGQIVSRYLGEIDQAKLKEMVKPLVELP